MADAQTQIQQDEQQREDEYRRQLEATRLASRVEDESDEEGAEQIQESKSGSGAITKTARGVGRSAQVAGKGVEVAGKGTELAGKGVGYAGKATEAVGKGVTKGGLAMARAGASLSETGLGAIVGVPLAVAGGATAAAGVGTQAVGKGIQAGGKGVEVAGKGIGRAGATTKNVGGKISSFAKGNILPGGGLGSAATSAASSSKLATAAITKVGGPATQLTHLALKRELEQAKKTAQSLAKGDVAGSIAQGTNLATGAVLKWAWLTILPSFGLSLIWINIHFVAKYFMGYKSFCQFGEEWSIFKSGISGKGLEIGLICLMVMLDVLYAILITIVATSGQVIGCAVSNPIGFIANGFACP